MDQWCELISRCRVLLDYIIGKENELIAARPIAGNLPALRKQQAAHQVSVRTTKCCVKKMLRHDHKTKRQDNRQ